MNSNFFIELSNKEKYKTVEKICNIEKYNSKRYHMLKTQKHFSVDKPFKPENRLQKVMEMLGEISKLIIENDFLTKYSDKNWYEDYFCKTNYYKYKNKAVEEFLYYYLNN
ncbi:MG284/MPN403 family protein [Mycoplasmopsis iners]|uniref:MG284/MPN403 family protein n=1 Tax=Mycoplasmopsis iners TaxID=76630 RepID=UPI0004964A73|nr:hypothetical protein [Mycoplasmopsis iners]